MKTNKEDIRTLKSKHRLELVIQETGEVFEVDAKNPDLWLGVKTPGLTVDIRRQVYEIKTHGMDVETGDIFTWVQRRYLWSFGMAIKFFQNRLPDPKHKPRPKKRVYKIARHDEDEIKPLDRLQAKALQIAGERIREYFSWSWWSLAMLPETRIEPTHAPRVRNCAHCGNRIDWHFEKTMYFEKIVDGFKYEHIGSIPVIAYSIKHRMDVSSFVLERSKVLTEIFSEAKINKALQKKISWAIGNSFDGLIDAAGALFVEDEDGVVCAKCAWKEYDFLIALDLCKRSARVKDVEIEMEDHEAGIEAAYEGERVMDPADIDQRDSGAGGKT